MTTTIKGTEFSVGMKRESFSGPARVVTAVVQKQLEAGARYAEVTTDDDHKEP